MMDFNNYLFIVAHADDETIAAGGYISKLTNSGKNVTVVVATDGATGFDDSGNYDNSIVSVRSKELKKAAKILGVKNVIQLGLPCQGLNYDKQNLHIFIEQIRKIKPDLIITHTQQEKHSDHINLSKLVTQAAWKSSENILPNLGSFHTVRDVWGFECVDVVSDPDYLIVLSENDVQRKLKALKCYSSQDNVIKGITQYVKGLLSVRGYQCGEAYAEAFKRISILPMRL